MNTHAIAALGCAVLAMFAFPGFSGAQPQKEGSQKAAIENANAAEGTDDQILKLELQIKTDEKNPRLRGRLAEQYLKQKKFDLAIQEARTALKLDEKFAPAFNTLGHTYKQMRRPEEAITAFQQSLKLRAGNSGAHIALAAIYRDKHDDQSALREYRLALLTLQPKIGEVYLGLADVLYRKERFRDALTNYQQLLILDPTNARALRGAGRCLERLGEFEAAIQPFELALEQAPNDLDLLERLGRAYERSLRKDKARAVYRRFLADATNLSDPNFAKKRTAIEARLAHLVEAEKSKN